MCRGCASLGLRRLRADERSVRCWGVRSVTQTNARFAGLQAAATHRVTLRERPSDVFGHREVTRRVNPVCNSALARVDRTDSSIRLIDKQPFPGRRYGSL
jgi:hypothetical protein